jgi:quercetin dioxygenase-like cupin family protein
VKIEGVPFSATDWASVPAVEHKGESGTSFWRTFEVGNLRVRVVEYSPGFKSDHWCARGHVLYVVDGEITVKLKDGREFVLTSGISFQAEDDASNPHLVRSNPGARVFIVD